MAVKRAGLSSLFKFTIPFFLFFGSLHSASAQQKYWVLLKDKAGVQFDPYSYFDQKAIDRRIRQNLPVADETDKPLKPEYFNQIQHTVDSVSGSSRWLNAIACFAKPSQIAEVQKFAFVKEIIPIESEALFAAKEEYADFKNNLNDYDQELLKKQLAIFGDSVFQKAKLDGSGMRIAVFDAGFTSVDVNPAFEHIRKANRILKTWDFVKGKEFVYGYASHGTMVLSCIGGKLEDKNIGLATGAEFLLARTEFMQREPFSEEENWLEALEWADKNGADIINSSLGYTNKRYFKSNMDGRYSLVTRAANLAARKGILVVNSNGNEGAGDWKILGAPADADSVLAIGGIDPDNLYHIPFSSYGPTADKRMKPNVVAFGRVVASGPGKMSQTQGTSFSSPLVAGFAACAWQAKRKLTNMELFREIEKSGNLYPYFDYAHGFGVPQAGDFLNGKPVIKPTFGFKRTGNQLQVFVNTEFLIDAMPVKKAMQLPHSGYGHGNVLPDEEDPENEIEKGLLYYNFTNPRGTLDKYFVVAVTEPEVLSLNLEELPEGTTIRVFFKGYTSSYTYKLEK